MNNNYKFELFVPDKIVPKINGIDFCYLQNTLHKHYIYSPRGRYSLFHILKSTNIKGNVILPAYCCPTIKEAVIKANCKPIFCDIDISDLNISFDCFIKLQRDTNSKVVIVPSLYGNPAALDKFESYCKKNDIFLIDDSAQSFGSMLNGKYLSTFGDAGLFSFSPGKSTPAHMGSLFWTNRNYHIKRTSHDFLHKLIFYSYIINRLNIYNNQLSNLYRKMINNLAIVLEKTINISNDSISDYENRYLGGVLEAVFNKEFEYRNYYFNLFVKSFTNNDFLIINNTRGEPLKNKIVLLFDSEYKAYSFSNYLLKNEVKTYSGYKIDKDAKNCINAKFIENKIVELPIENNENKMKYLFDLINNYH